MKISEKGLFEVIQKIENDNDCTQLVFDGLHLWPLIRVCLREAFLLEHRGEDDFKEERKTLHFKNPLSPFRWIRDWSRLLFGTRSRDILVLSQSSFMSDRMDEKQFDRHADPLLEVLSESDSNTWIKVAAQLGGHSVQDPFFPTRFLDIRNFVDPLRYVLVRRRFNKMVQVHTLVEEIHDQTSLDIQGLLSKTVAFILATQRAIRWMLRRINPGTVFMICYYSRVNLAFLYACRTLGIRTIDVQHGKQGIYHLMYVHWSHIPADGFNVVPDYFANWGQDSVNAIAKYQQPGSAHIPVAIGNLWLQRYQKNKPSENPLRSFCDPYTSTVCFSLQQQMKQPIPEFVLQAIEDYPEVCWLFRLHPNQSTGNSKVLEVLSGLNSTNWELEMASRMPLYDVLSLTNWHMTNWSSVCIEALSFGIPSIIVHQNGHELYDYLIQDGSFRYASTTEEVRSGVMSDAQIQDADHFFVSDPSLSRQRIAELLADTVG